MCITALLFQSSLNIHGQAAIQTSSVPLVFQARYNQQSAGPFEAAFYPFLIPNTGGFAAGIYTEKKFMLEHINTVTVAACKAFDNGGVSALLYHFGNLNFVERLGGVAYAKKISRLVAAIDFRFGSISISNSDRVSFIQIGVGGLVQVNDNVNVVMKIADPPLLQSKRRATRTSVTFGGGWQITPSFYAGLETCKQELQPLLLTAAIEYQHSDKMSIGLSWMISTNQPSASVSWQIGNMKVKSGSVYHPILGASPFASFAIHKRDHILK